MVTVSRVAGAGPLPVGAPDEDEGAVELVHLVEEDVEVEGERLRHPVLAVVGGEVVVPLPDVPRERLLGVHLDLLDVEVLPEELARRLDEPGVAHDPRVDLASKVEAHGGSHRVALLLAEVLGAPLGEEPGQLRLERLHLLRREPLRQNQEPVLPEPLDLGFMKSHRPSSDRSSSSTAVPVGRPEAQHRTFEVVSARRGILPGIDPLKRNRLVDELETDGFLERGGDTTPP